MPKGERLKEKSRSLGNRHDRKLKKYSEGFNENFRFFFLLSRRGLIDFCGERINILSSSDRTLTAKHCFKLFEDGRYGREKVIECNHPNVMRHVMMGKKGWSLWCNTWGAGCGDRTFHKKDILEEFHKKDIHIPDCFMLQLEKTIEKEKEKFNLQTLEWMRKYHL